MDDGHVFGLGAVGAAAALIVLGVIVEAWKGVGAGNIGRFIACLFERHKFVRRIAIFWMFALVSHAHFIVYGIVAEQGTLDGVLPFFSLTVGLVATLTAWYLQVRYHEDRRDV